MTYKRLKMHTASCSIKGAFGCVSMFKAILRKYELADPGLLEKLEVLFVHCSGKGKNIVLVLLSIHNAAPDVEIL